MVLFCAHRRQSSLWSQNIVPVWSADCKFMDQLPPLHGFPFSKPYFDHLLQVCTEEQAMRELNDSFTAMNCINIRKTLAQYKVQSSPSAQGRVSGPPKSRPCHSYNDPSNHTLSRRESRESRLLWRVDLAFKSTIHTGYGWVDASNRSKPSWTHQAMKKNPVPVSQFWTCSRVGSWKVTTSHLTQGNNHILSRVKALNSCERSLKTKYYFKFKQKLPASHNTGNCKSSLYPTKRKLPCVTIYWTCSVSAHTYFICLDVISHNLWSVVPYYLQYLSPTWSCYCFLQSATRYFVLYIYIPSLSGSDGGLQSSYSINQSIKFI